MYTSNSKLAFDLDFVNTSFKFIAPETIVTSSAKVIALLIAVDVAASETLTESTVVDFCNSIFFIFGRRPENSRFVQVLVRESD